MRYFFDIHQDDECIPDEEGMIFPNVEAAQEEAATSLADLAREMVRERAAHHVAIAVRDVHGPIVDTTFAWTVQRRH